MEIQYIDKFEYSFKSFNGYSIQKIVDEMNKLGNEGWEFITISNDNLGRSCYIFKRKIVSTRV